MIEYQGVGALLRKIFICQNIEICTTLKMSKFSNSKKQFIQKIRKSNFTQDIFIIYKIVLMFQVFINSKLVHCRYDRTLEILENKVVVVNRQSGRIHDIFDGPFALEKLNGISEETLKITQLTDKQFFLPGMIDTHIHAPQFANNGCALDVQLLDWLNKYTFPQQSKFKDLEYAEKIYQACVQAIIMNGTTTVCFYGTLHNQATQLLASIIDKRGLRGFVGKVCMDTNSPSYYIEQNAEASLSDTVQYIEKIQKRYPRITPVVTPRFAISCSKQLLEGLGQISKKFNLPVQTHLSQNKNQIQFAGQLFPQFQNYTQIYDKTGLIGDRTVLAHCVYLSEKEICVLKEKRAGISHCPNSNISITSGIAPIRKYLNEGMKIGLGTDCSGGYSPSMFNSIRYSILSSKIINMEQPQFKPLNFAEALFLATRGGAQLLGLEQQVGYFANGMQFDAILVDYSNFKQSYIKEKEPMIETVQKMLYLLNQNQISKVFVRGLEIKKQ